MALTNITLLVASLVDIPDRLRRVVAAYLLSLMVEAPRHTQSFAASLTGVGQGQFSRLLANHKTLALDCLNGLAKNAAKTAAKFSRPLIAGAPWTIGIIIDSTLHRRSSLNVNNAQRFNHGDGFVIGHQWTNIVLYIDDRVIPLPPIAFLTRKECKRRGIDYKTEHEHIEAYLGSLNLASYVGSYSDEEVVVLTDAGYDNKRLQRAVLDRGWDFISAIKSCRGARGRWESQAFGKIKWRTVGDLFWAMRGQTPWATVRIKTDGGQKRREFRARKLEGHLKGISRDLALVCSKKAKGKGYRYFACSNSAIGIGAIVRMFSLRWQVELFHRATKHQLGLVDAGVEDFASLESHVAWVYSAWLLLHELQISGESSLLGKQRRLASLAARSPLINKLQRIVDAKFQFGGAPRQEALLRAALEEAMAA